MQPDDLLPQLIARRAQEDGERTYLVEAESGEFISYEELDLLGRIWGGALQDLGVREGDRVVTILSPSIAAVAAWLGLAWLRAAPVAINPALSGNPLHRALKKADSRTLLVGVPHVETLRDADGVLKSFSRLITVGVDRLGAAPSIPDGECVETYLNAARPLDHVGPRPHDLAAVLYTSGTTGYPKPVLVPWAQLRAAAAGHIPLGYLCPSDVWYDPFPFFHVSGLFPIYTMALAGGSLVLRDRFRTRAFWPDVRRYKCTIALMLGATAKFLLDNPKAPDDADNPLHSIIGHFPRADEFLMRFAIPHHYHPYNQTEMSVPITTVGFWNAPDGQTCGRVRTGYEVRLVDEYDEEVPRGATGELIVRAKSPWTLSPGYLNEPEATAAVWRNGWLHSGDLFRQDRDGWFYFVDRMSDSMRRRGENISSFEVEVEVQAHPAVEEVAAIGVPADDGDQEIKVVVVAREGRALNEALLADWLEARLPRFMVPRYIEIVKTLPRTETGKVRKAQLRETGVTRSTWDRKSRGRAENRLTSRDFS